MRSVVGSGLEFMPAGVHYIAAGGTTGSCPPHRASGDERHRGLRAAIDWKLRPAVPERSTCRRASRRSRSQEDPRRPCTACPRVALPAKTASTQKECCFTAAASLVDQLLKGCTGLRIVATSREPLGLDRVQQFALGPLNLHNAILLFTDRAAAVSPTLAASQDEIADLCHHLDRLPLAIELAAARTRPWVSRYPQGSPPGVAPVRTRRNLISQHWNLDIRPSRRLHAQSRAASAT